MGKPSSTISAEQAYNAARLAGYELRLVNTERPLHSMSWSAVRDHPNVAHSQSGGKVILVDGTGTKPVRELQLRTRGMLLPDELKYFEQKAGIRFE